MAYGSSTGNYPRFTRLEDVLLNLPVSVNSQSGDPFQPDQEANTFAKLRALEHSKHKGAVGLLTKWNVSDKTLRFIAKFQLNIFMFYSVTGLQESSIHTQENVLRSYSDACRILQPGRVAIFIRPIIPGRNNNLTKLKSILEAAQQGQRMIIARGFRDKTWGIISDEGFMKTLKEESEKRGLRLFHRTACLVAAIGCKPCALHGNELDNRGLTVADAMGYKATLCTNFKTKEGILDVQAQSNVLSMGDIHFVQILTGIRTQCETPFPSNKLAFLRGPRGVELDCSSSWFTFARNTPCKVGCFYCETAYRPRVWGEVGCPPIELIESLPRVSGEIL